MGAPLRDGYRLPRREKRQFFSPAELREQAVEQGRMADRARMSGRLDLVLMHIRRAKELTLAALALEKSKVLA